MKRITRNRRASLVCGAIMSLGIATAGLAVAAPVEVTPALEVTAAVPSDAGPAVDAGFSAGEGTAAATVPDPGDDPGGFLSAVYDAVRGGKWLGAVALLVVALVWAARRWGGKMVPWLRTDRGGAVLALAVSVLGALANAVLAGEGVPGWGVLWSALQVGFLAAGGFAVVKKILRPSDSR